MSSKQMVNVSEGACFRLRNVVSSQRQSEQTGLQISLGKGWYEVFYFFTFLPFYLWTDDDKTLVLIF